MRSASKKTQSKGPRSLETTSVAFPSMSSTSRFTQIKPLIALAWVVILSNLGILVWFFFQIHFRNRKTLRDTLLVFVGGDALIACSMILYVRAKTPYAAIPILIILVLRRFWGPPLIEKLQAEIEQEKSHDKGYRNSAAS
jgi:hypothetical protein